MLIEHNTTKLFMISGRVATVRAFCREITDGMVRVFHYRETANYWSFDYMTYANWTIKIEYKGRAESFNYQAYAKGKNFDRIACFDDFLDRLDIDVEIALVHIDDFLAEFEYVGTSKAEGRKIWQDCSHVADKFRRVFGSWYSYLARYKDRREWVECDN